MTKPINKQLEESKIHLRGFASMNRDKQRDIASKGGKAAHKLKRAYEWNSETARIAGAKGGTATARKKAAKRREANGGI